MISVLLDILRCILCCNDSHFDDNYYHESSAANSSTRYRFSNLHDTSDSSFQQRLSNYPNFYNSSSSSKESERLLKKSGQESHNVKTSLVFPQSSTKPVAPPSPRPRTASMPSPLQPPLSNRLQSSPVFPQSTSQPVAPLPAQSTLPSHLFLSSSIKASSSSSSSSSSSNSLPSSSSPRLRTTATPSPFSSVLTKSSSKLPTAIQKPSENCSLLSQTSPKGATYTSGLPASSPKPPPTSNPTLRPAPSNSTNARDYLLDANSSMPLYLIPKDVEDLIEKNIVPEILKKPLSVLTYKRYFAALLYAEDFYHKKWSKYRMENITLELQETTISRRTNNGFEKVNKTFVAFEIDSVPERRPFLLSRDLVHARPLGSTRKPFQGFVYRVAKRNVLLVDFGEDFHSWHRKNNKYDISFTFNRVCLKRAHQAIEDASDSLFQNFLFSESRSRKRYPRTPVMHSSYHQLDSYQKNAVGQISFFQSSPPYLIKGPSCIHTRGWGENRTSELSRTGFVVQASVYQIYSTSPDCRVLICSPTNITCDEMMLSLKKLLPESDMFRAIAAFRELNEVPEDILSSCDYDNDNDCFSCPQLDELRRYKIIFSTFMSSFRLHDKGLPAGHFSHIFLLDASAAIEPETLVPLTKFATDSTAVIVTGQTGKQPYWIRSDIARRHGLKTPYFERLETRWPYRSLSPLFVSDVYEEDSKGEDRSMSARLR